MAYRKKRRHVRRLPVKRRKARRVVKAKRSVRKALARPESKLVLSALNPTQLAAANTYLVNAAANPNTGILCTPYFPDLTELNGVQQTDLTQSIFMPGAPARTPPVTVPVIVQQACAGFLMNGTGTSQRVGRSVFMKGASIRMVLQIGPNPGPGGAVAFAPQVMYRVIHGWVKGGIHAFLSDSLADIDAIYEDINFVKYRILSDKMHTAVARYSGLDAARVASYRTLDLKFNWRVNKRLRFSADSDGIQDPGVAVYEGWTPFALIVNGTPEGSLPKLMHYRRMFSYYDV